MVEERSKVLAWDDRSLVRITQENGDRQYQTPDGHELVSTTTVLGKIYHTVFPDVASKQVEFARSRGIEVHRAIALLCGHFPGYTLDFDTLDSEVAPRVGGFQNWKKDRDWTPVYVERVFMDMLYGCAGSPDQVGTFNGDTRLTIVDFKPKDAKLVKLQLASYSSMVKSSLGLNYVPRKISLHLTGDGKYKEREIFEHFRYRDLWRSALSSYNYGREIGVW